MCRLPFPRFAYASDFEPDFPIRLWPAVVLLVVPFPHRHFRPGSRRGSVQQNDCIFGRGGDGLPCARQTNKGLRFLLHVISLLARFADHASWNGLQVLNDIPFTASFAWTSQLDVRVGVHIRVVLVPVTAGAFEAFRDGRLFGAHHFLSDSSPYTGYRLNRSYCSGVSVRSWNGIAQ